MGNVVFNVAKGRVGELFNRVDANDPANSAIVVVLLASSGLESDATLIDYDTLGAILSAANDEATNTGYSRKVLTDSDIAAVAPDDTNNWQQAIIADQSWTLTNDGTGAVGALLVCYDADTTGGADTAIIPLTKHDFAVTPDGSVVTADVSADGVYRAA